MVNTRGKKKRRRIFRGAVLLLVLFFIVAGCGDFFDAYRSVKSLRQVDDYPLYVMHYYGEIPYRDFQTGQGVKGIWKFFRDRMSADLAAGDGQNNDDGEQRRAWACSCIAGLGQEGDKCYGRNFDWSTKAALMLFTDPPDGYASVSMVDITYLGISTEGIKGLESLRLLAAPHIPSDGMNECGLAIGVMAIPKSDGGNDPAKETVGSVYVIREILDHAKDVEEAITMLEGWNIDFVGGPTCHYLISDKGGNSAVIEFLDGKPTVTRNTEPWQAATNFIIAGVNKEDALAPCWRYKRAYKRLEQCEGVLKADATMELLKKISMPGWTAWSIVYELETGRGQIAMGRGPGWEFEFQLGRGDDVLVKSDIWPKQGDKATRPVPADGTNIHPESKVKLDWLAGKRAKTHRVFYGTDSDNLRLWAEVTHSKEVKLPELERGVVYYWRVDEVDAEGTVTRGDMWHFGAGDLEGCWEFDGDLTDNSGHDRHGRSQGDPRWTVGRKDQGLAFNGVDDIVELGEMVELPTWTVAMWVNSQKPKNAKMGLPFNGETQFNFSWNHPDGFFRGAAATCVGGKWWAASFGELKSDKWIHLCATYDGERLKSYRNGVLVSTNPSPSGPCKTTEQNIHAGGKNFCGILDDLRIYSYVLHEREIKRLAR